ncbi:MAG: hypothetical protein ACI4RA_02030, partial [Kiritimatiellia bacterium]
TLAAAGTVCVTNGGTFGWSDLTIASGTVRIASGGVVAANLKTQGGGTLVVSDGAGIATPLTLDGGTLRFDADTVLGNPILQTRESVIAVAEGKMATLTGLYTNQGGKCKPSGPGELVFAGGGEFNAGCELFVQGGRAVIEKKDFRIAAYFGVEQGGRRLVVRDGAKVTGLENTKGYGLHVGTWGGFESVFEVGAGGVVELEEGFHCQLGASVGGVGRLRVAEGGVFRHKSQAYFSLAGAAAATGSVEVVGGVFETRRTLGKGNGPVTSLLFENATVKALDGLTLLVDGNIPGTMRGANTLDVGANSVTLGGAWTGAGSLAVTGAGGDFCVTTAQPGWTGALAVNGADLMLGDGVALDTYPVTVEGGEIAVAAGTASLPLLDGAAATKTGAGTLVLAGVQDPAFDLTVVAGGVRVAPSGKMQPAGVPAGWLDAAAASSFTRNGANVSRWSDRRSGVPFYARTVEKRNAPLYNATGFDGRPFVDFGVMGDNEKGRAGDNRVLEFNAQQKNIRTVFWMVGSRNGGGFLLGDATEDSGRRSFHRDAGPNTTYGAVASDPIWSADKDRGGLVKNGTTWLNGVTVDGTKTGLGGAWDLVGWRLAEGAADTPSATWLASCYNPENGRLNGGQDLAEILIYTNRLTDAEVRATQRYLADKWMPTNAANRVEIGTLTMRGAGTSFTVEAGVPVSVAKVVVEGRGVTVRGVAEANEVALGDVVVATGGEWNAANFQGATVTNLTLAENAIVGAVIDEAGHADALTVQGTLTLPSALLYSVSMPEKATVHRTAILVAATLAGSPSWARAEGFGSGAAISVDAAARALVLRGLSGTVLYLR